MKLEFVVESGEKTRLDVFLTAETEYTRSKLKQLIDGGYCTVDGVAVKCGYNLKEGQKIVLDVPETKPCNIEPVDIPLEILFEDEEIVVVNKPQGLTVHPSATTTAPTLVNALLFHIARLSGVGGIVRAGIVHRLDKETSGAIIVAKTDKAHVNLANQFAARTVGKLYLGVTEGVVKQDAGTIITNIGRSPKDRKKMAVVPDGRPALTKFKVLERFDKFSLVQFDIITGRTHQIRVHSQYLGNPIAGDKIYGSGKGCANQLLHSYRITFSHPTTNKSMTLTAPVPAYFNEFLEQRRSLS